MFLFFLHKFWLSQLCPPCLLVTCVVRLMSGPTAQWDPDEVPWRLMPGGVSICPPYSPASRRHCTSPHALGVCFSDFYQQKKSERRGIYNFQGAKKRIQRIRQIHAKTAETGNRVRRKAMVGRRHPEVRGLNAGVTAPQLMEVGWVCVQKIYS